MIPLFFSSFVLLPSLQVLRALLFVGEAESKQGVGNESSFSKCGWRNILILRSIAHKADHSKRSKHTCSSCEPVRQARRRIRWVENSEQGRKRLIRVGHMIRSYELHIISRQLPSHQRSI